MLGSAVRCSPDDLVAFLGEDDATPEERVLSRIRESRELVDADPAAAWNRAIQAFNLLGRADLPNGVADLSVRREAHENLLHVGSRILVDGADTRGAEMKHPPLSHSGGCTRRCSHPCVSRAPRMD